MDLDDEELIVTKNKCKYYKDIEQTLIRRVIGDLYAIRNKLHSEAIEKGYDGAYLNKSIDLAIDIINAASVESAEKDKIIAEKSAEIEKLKRDFKIVDQECSRLEKKEAKQDKMIDLMAEELQTHMFVVSVGKTIIGKKGIKEYYEQKATNDV